MTTLALQELITKYALLNSQHVQATQVGRLDTTINGIIFVMATWSGQAIAAFRSLTGVLASEFHDYAIPVMVCDADELTSDFVAALGRVPQGYGETIWVKDRKIIGILPDYRVDHWADIVKTNTRMIVESLTDVDRLSR